MDIIVKTTYDLNAFKALNRLVSFRGKKPTGRLVLVSVLFIITLSFALLIGWQDPELLAPGLIGAGVYGIIAALFFFQAFGLPRLQYKQMQKLGLTDIIYTFGEEKFSAVSTSENGSGTTELKYSALCKAAETDSYFFIYQTINQIMIVDKSGIQNGSAEDIAKRLKTHLGKKYKRIRRK